MAIKLKSNSAYDGQVQETNTAARQYYLPNNDSGLGTQLMTAQATTSGTNIDFTGIPSWVKRITVMFNGVSTNGTSVYLIQLGTSSGIVNSGYAGVGKYLASASFSSGTSTAGMMLGNSVSAANAYSGHVVIIKVSGDIWTGFGAVSSSDNSSNMTISSVTLSGTLDRVRLTTVNGTDAFDSGSVSVMYE